MINKCCVDKENVEAVANNLPSKNELVEVSELFKLLGDPSRMRIVSALRIKELCVGDLAELMYISQSGVSHQLRLLKKERIVKTRREGKLIYYSLNDSHVEEIIDIALAHIHHED